MFIHRLKELRAQKNISQAALGDVLGLSQQAIAKWETNKATPDPDMLAKLADFFGVTVDDLLDRDTISSTPNKKMPKELLKILEQEDYTLNGEIASPEDKEKIAKIIELMYWDAKEQNKRKK